MGNEYCDDRSGHDGYSLPRHLQRALGLNTTLGKFEFESLPPSLQEEIDGFLGSDPPSDLSDLNDLGIPFPLIAKVIRARPKGLFREDAA
jgi:hypothetical protein